MYVCIKYVCMYIPKLLYSPNELLPIPKDKAILRYFLSFMFFRKGQGLM